MKIKNILITTALVFALGIYAEAQTVPNLKLKDMNGTTINTSSVAANGKVTVLNFWATWCGPCKNELDNIAELYEDWTDDYNVEVIAVSTDDSKTVGRVKPTVNAKDWPYKVWLDTNGELKRALGGTTVPFTVVIDTEGKIVYTHTGYTEGDEYDLEELIEELSE